MSLLEVIKDMVPYELQRDPQVLHLDLNEYDFDHHPSVYDALRNAVTLHNISKYSCSKTEIHHSLVKKIADYVNLPSNYLILVNGCDSAIKLVMDCYKKTTVYIHEPTYRQYERMSKISGFNIVHVDEKNLMNFKPSEEIVFICSPGQPTGHLVDNIEQYLVAHPKTLFVVDETYMDYLMLVGKSQSVTPLCSKYHNLIVLKSMSKAFGLAGMRIGVIVSHSDNIEAFEKVYNSKDVHILSKIVADQVFTHLSWYEDKARLMYDIQRRIVTFLRTNGEYVEETPCNFILLKNRALHEYLDQHKIMIRPIGQDFSRLTVPSQTNSLKLLNILAKYYLFAKLDVRCICLKERDDRYQYACNEFARNHINNVNYHRPQRDPRGGEMGCWESHKYCMKHSQKNLVCIFEDDFKFVSEPDWMSVYQFLDKPDIMWDTLHIGSILISMEESVNDAIWKVKCNATHAYITRKTMCDAPDFDPELHQGGIDDYYRRFSRQYSLIEPKCIQKAGLPTDTQWYPINTFQYIFQHPKLFEMLQIKTNNIASYCSFLPTWIQPWINPIACSLMLNAFVYNGIRKIRQFIHF
jgi:histidinol-phosphate/aromatic aminotransferase/cobyric acid decarboxylase-like protein